MTRERYVAALRALAEFWEGAHPTVPHPETWNPDGDELRLHVWVDVDQLGDVARALGSADKVVDESYFSLRRRVSPEATVSFFNARDAVCKKRVVGVERVEEKVATGYEVRMVEREVVEWDCPSSLLDPKVRARAVVEGLAPEPAAG